MKVVAYCRLSKDDGDGESSSIKNQKLIIQEYAEKNGLEIDEFFVDDGVSGYSLDRPAFNRLKEGLNNDEIGVIIAKDLSRIGRNSGKVQVFLEKIFEAGKRLITVSDNYDTSNEMSRDTAGIHTWINEIYIRDVSKKIRKSIDIMQKEGKYISSVPYGYVIDPFVKGKYDIDEVAAIYVKKIFEMYTNGAGLKSIAIALMEQNAPTNTVLMKQRLERRGQEYKGKVSTTWYSNVIRDILKNDFYIGTLTLNKTKRRVINGKKIPTPQDERLVFENAHPAIIDANTFNIAQEMLADRAINAYRGHKVKGRAYAYSGILYCADCGKKLTSAGRRDNTRYVCRTYNERGTNYCSSHSLSESDITESIQYYLQHCRKNLINVIEQFDNIVEEENMRRNNNYDLVVLLQKDLQEAKTEIKYLMEQKMKETIKNPSMADIIEETYQGMLDEKFAKVKSLEQQIADQESSKIDDKETRHNLTTALQVFDDVIQSGKMTKKQVATIINKITVYESGDIDIYLKGNLHELCGNHVSVKLCSASKMMDFVLEYMLERKDKFTGRDCFNYITKEKGIKIGSPNFYEFIRTLEAMKIIEKIGYNKGYRMLMDKEEAMNVLLSNNVPNSSTWSDNKDVTWDTIEEVNKWMDNIKDSKSKKLF